MMKTFWQCFELLKKTDETCWKLNDIHVPVCVLDEACCVVASNMAYDTTIGRDKNTKIDFIEKDTSVKHNVSINNCVYDISSTYDHPRGLYILLFHDVSHYAKRMGQINTILNSMLPSHVIEAVSSNNIQDIPKHHENVSVCFIDIREFTSMCKLVTPEEVMYYLNALFSDFDKVADKYNVTKHEIIGDCYVAISGVLQTKDGIKNLIMDDDSPENFADNMVLFACEVIAVAHRYEMPGNRQKTQVRVGIHTGDVVSGLIDNRVPRFALFGDTMNIASRMESSARPMHVRISDNTFKALSPKYREDFVEQIIDVKGAGSMVTYQKHIDAKNLAIDMGEIATASTSQSSLNLMNNVICIANFTNAMKHVDMIKPEVSKAESKFDVGSREGSHVPKQDISSESIVRASPSNANF